LPSDGAGVFARGKECPRLIGDFGENESWRQFGEVERFGGEVVEAEALVGRIPIADVGARLGGMTL
jgi:hypothetical protein